MMIQNTKVLQRPSRVRNKATCEPDADFTTNLNET